jgi:hypothetical protein
MSYHATRAEQETVIRWDREDEMVHVWSASPITWRKLKRLGIEPTRETRYRNTDEVSGRFYTVLLSLFRWGLKRPRPPGQAPRGFAARIARSRQERPEDRDSGPGDPVGNGRRAGHAGPPLGP